MKANKKHYFYPLRPSFALAFIFLLCSSAAFAKDHKGPTPLEVEIEARMAADADLQAQIEAETAARIFADKVEALTRTKKDEVLQDNIDGIELTPGPQGPQGDTGSAGTQGPQGPQGDTGPQGLEGIAGMDAPDRDAALCELYALTGSPAPAFCERIVFTTSTTYSADLGGVPGADALCQQAAIDGGLPGEFLAWLATSPENEPKYRFTHSIHPYVTTQGAVIAIDWTDLIDGTILSSISIDEFGDSLIFNSDVPFVWTGLTSSGTSRSDNSTQCAGFTSASALSESALAGYVFNTNGGWSGIARRYCDNSYRLYCFQQ